MAIEVNRRYPSYEAATAVQRWRLFLLNFAADTAASTVV
jgi:hypothetical protein